MTFERRRNNYLVEPVIGADGNLYVIEAEEGKLYSFGD